MARTDPNTVQSVRRAAALLDCFADGRTDRSLTELAAATGLTTSTAHRLLRTLVQAGLIWHDPKSERYLPGPALLRLARAVLDQDDLSSTRELLESLAARTGLPVSLAVRAGDEVVTVMRVAADGSAAADPRSRPRLPLHASALGKALLAFAVPPDSGRPGEPGPTEVPEALTALGPLAAFTAATLDVPEKLAADLARTRARAYAVEDLEHRPDSRAVAVPVRDADGRLVAALGVAGHPEELAPDAVPGLGRLLAAAAGALAVPRSLLQAPMSTDPV